MYKIFIRPLFFLIDPERIHHIVFRSLRIMGYRTDVVEFVSTEHTARNLMIRAIRGLPMGEPDFVREYLAMKGFWGVTPYIERAMGEAFQEAIRGPLSSQNQP